MLLATAILGAFCVMWSTQATAPTALAQPVNDAVQDRIRAKSIVIVNDKQEVVARLDGYSGGGALSLESPGEPRKTIDISASDRGAAILITDEDGGRRQLSLYPFGWSVNRWTPELVKTRRRYISGEEQLSMEDAQQAILGYPVVSVSSNGLGGGVIDVYNPIGVVVATMQANKSNDGAVYVKDATGTVVRPFTAR